MKKTYQEPVVDVTMFFVEDVITTSGNGITGGEPGPDVGGAGSED